MAELSKIAWTDLPAGSRRVPGFEAYAVSPNGKVWSSWARAGQGKGYVTSDAWREKIPDVGVNGYYRIELWGGGGKKKRFLLHRLVLELFVGMCPDGMQACHGDGDRANNAVDNLRWDTRKENHADRKRHGNGGEGAKQRHAKLTELDVLTIRHLRSQVPPVRLRVLAERFGVSTAKISQVALKKNWKHVNG